MGNNSLFMENTNSKNKLYYIPNQRRNISFVSSPESIYNNNYFSNNNNNYNNNIGYYIAKKTNDNKNLNKKLNSSSFEIINNSNNINNSQCYNKDYNKLIRKISYNKIGQEIIDKNISNNKKINRKTSVPSFINKSKSLNNNINYSGSNTEYSKQGNNNKNINIKMKTPASVITSFNLDGLNPNDTLVSSTYVSPIYYTSSMPITSTTQINTTACMKLNRNSLKNSSNTTSSLLNSYYCDDDEQYLVNNNNTITYIVNSSHNDKTLNTQNKSTSLINQISTSNNNSTINNICYDQTKMNNDNTISSNNTQVKSLLPIEYYTNNFNHGRYLMKTNEIVNPTATNNPNTSSTNINDTQIISSSVILSKSNTSPNLNPIENAAESNYTTLEQEKIRRPMMYSTTNSTTNILNISPVVTTIGNNINNNNNSDISTSSNNIGKMSVSSNSTTTSSSTISILSSASSGNSNLILKDTELTCSPESTYLKDSMEKKSKPKKKKSNSNLCDKSGIIGFAAEILTSVLPTSNNDLKHPKTRYLPELYPFIKKIARKCKIDIRTFLYALVYSQRFGEALLSHHKEAVGEYGTNHRIFLASILLAYQYQIDHGIKVNFKLDAKKLSKYTDGVWTEKEVEMMCKAFLSTKNFILDINDEVVKEFVETHKTDLCWYS